MTNIRFSEFHYYSLVYCLGAALSTVARIAFIPSHQHNFVAIGYSGVRTDMDRNRCTYYKLLSYLAKFAVARHCYLIGESESWSPGV